MKKDWKAGMLAPAEARREEKVFVPVMQRARICLFVHLSVFAQYSNASWGAKRKSSS